MNPFEITVLSLAQRAGIYPTPRLIKALALGRCWAGSAIRFPEGA